MLKLLKYLKPYTWSVLILFVLTYIQVATTLKLPDYMAIIINNGIVKENNSLILQTGFDMLAVSLIGGLAMIGVSFLASRIAASFSRDVRGKIFAKVESFSLVEFNKFSTASLITRSTNDIQQIQMVLTMILRMVLMAPMLGIIAVWKAYQLAPNMSWIMALSIGVMFSIIIILFTIALPKFKELQTMVDKLNLITRQILTGLRVIRAFNTQKLEEKNFDKANVDLTNLNLFVNRLMVVIQPLMMVLMNFTALLVIWVGAHYVDSGSLAIGDMIAFMQYSIQAIMGFLMFSIVFIMIPSASVSAVRINEVIETDIIIKDPANPVLPKKKTGLVEFKNVYFSYPGADMPVLEDVSFLAHPGQTTALIGSTGSGKSTIVNLIPRFYDVTDGEVSVDGVDVRKLRQEELWHKIGYVPQRAVLFSGTVESNIKYGAPAATWEAINEATRIAQATEFVETLPQGFKNSIAQGGTNISGGQKQRLSIARAVARDPEIYIFDDSFSALDFATEAKLRRALIKVTKAKTVIVVAQRISSIMNADQIIVLNEGKIVGTGRHRDLLAACPVYKEIALSQLSGEEIESHLSTETVATA